MMLHVVRFTPNSGRGKHPRRMSQVDPKRSFVVSGENLAFSLLYGTRYGKNGRREPKFATPVLQLAGGGNQSPARLFD